MTKVSFVEKLMFSEREEEKENLSVILTVCLLYLKEAH